MLQAVLFEVFSCEYAIIPLGNAVLQFYFFYLGPVCLSSGFKHCSLVAYCATLNCHSAQIQYPCVSYKETEILK